MKNQILLFKNEQAWMCEHVGDAAEEIIKLFGTNIIPSAFTAHASPQMVLNKIKKLNPEWEVKLK